MSKEAAEHFVAEVKKTRKHYQEATHFYYDEFISKGHAPDDEDVKNLEKIVHDMQAVAKVYHSTAAMCIQGFGGGADTEIHTASTLLNTVRKKAEEAKARHAAAASGHGGGSAGGHGTAGPAGATHH